MKAPVGHSGGPAPEFSRVFPVEPAMGNEPDAQAVEIAAEPGELEALARRFDLRSLDALSAKGGIEVFDDGRQARLTATLKADVVQSCVVTLAPVPAHIEETFTVEYDRDVAEIGDGTEGEVVIEAEGEEPPDPLTDAGIDVGEAVAEHLGLALDPYPRAPGAALPEGWNTEAEPPESPFAVLGKLKKF